jgi:tetratricopeptide (TPR) repeat protein
MIPNTIDRSPRPSLGKQRRAGILALVALVFVTAGCFAKSEAQQALDELNAGLASSSAGKTDEAVAHYRACLKHDSLNEFCIYNLGVIAQNAGRAAEAENDYRLALLIDPEFPSALFNLAIVRTNAGSIPEAMDIYRHYIKVRPNDASGHLNLGLLLRANGQVAAGELELAKAKALDPTINIPTFQPQASASPTPAGPSPSAP